MQIEHLSQSIGKDQTKFYQQIGTLNFELALIFTNLIAVRSHDIEKAIEICGDSYQCKYDYAMSLNRDMALIGKGFHDQFVNIKAENMRPGEKNLVN
jgi:hypothetical protein